MKREPLLDPRIFAIFSTMLIDLETVCEMRQLKAKLEGERASLEK